MSDPHPRLLETDPVVSPAGSRLRTWLCLGVVVLACAVPMLVDLGARDTTHTMEGVAMVVSQETWLRGHEGGSDPLITWNDTMPRVRKPPLLTWLHEIAWSNLDPETASPRQLLIRARLVAVAMGMLVLVAIFWTGCTLGDLGTAVIAALMAGSVFFLQRQARAASYDIHFTAWATLAIASAVWAIEPRRTGSSGPRVRAVLGWLGAGLALSAAVMTKNPLALPIVILPILATIILQPHRRSRHLLGLAGAIFVTLAICGPWYVYVFRHYPEAAGALPGEFRQSRVEFQAVYYYIGLIVLVAPWSVWLVVGLVHPFMVASAPRRRLLLAPWLWFVLIFLLFSIPAAKQQRYILPIIPAAGLLVAGVFRDHEDRARAGDSMRSERGLIWLHWGGLLAASLLFGPFLFAQDRIAWFTPPTVGNLAALPAAALSLVLTLLALAGFRAHRRGRSLQAGVTTAAWALVLLGVFWHCYGRAPSAAHPIRASAESFRAHVGERPVRSLRVGPGERWEVLNDGFRLYYGRLISQIQPDELAGWLGAAPPEVFILANDEPAHEQVLREAGFVDDGRYEVDPGEFRRLWVYRK